MATFEIDTVQSLSLPVFLFIGNDSLETVQFDGFHYARSGVRATPQMPDSVSLAETSAYMPVSLQFNYPYWVIGLIILGHRGIDRYAGLG